MGPTSLPQPGEAEGDGSSSAEPECAVFFTAGDSRNHRRFLLWLLAAMLAYLGATAALRWRESIPRPFPPLLAGLAWLLAILAIQRYVVFLRRADELLRRIETEALALGFGAGVVLSLFYPLLEGLGAPRLDGEATALVMMLTSGVGSWLGRRRYSGNSAGNSRA